jgi:hypothetical protein
MSKYRVREGAACLLCGEPASEAEPIYFFNRDLTAIERAPGLAHFHCIRRERDRLEALRRGRRDERPKRKAAR